LKNGALNKNGSKNENKAQMSQPFKKTSILTTSQATISAGCSFFLGLPHTAKQKIKNLAFCNNKRSTMTSFFRFLQQRNQGRWFHLLNIGVSHGQPSRPLQKQVCAIYWNDEHQKNAPTLALSKQGK
jgi:hypothetical protein